MNDYQKRVLECALGYRQLGWKVLPLHTIISGRCSCGRASCGSPGKHPATVNGLKDATTDEETIREWFTGGRSYNIGIATGRESGLVVLDIDPKNGGSESIGQYRVPRTLDVITGSGGRHYYFAYPKSKEIRNSAGKLGAGLDVRGEGGYVVAPPSLHISGSEYKWAVDPRAMKPTECPAWIPGQARYDREPANTGIQKCTNPGNEEIPEGCRNDKLASIAGAMRRQGCNEQDIYAAMIHINQTRCKPPLEYEELERIANSIVKYPPEEDDLFTLADDHHDTVARVFEQWSPVRHRHYVETWAILKDHKYIRVDEREVKKWVRKFAVQCLVRKKIRADGEFKTIKQRLKVTPHLVCGVLGALSAMDEVWIKPRYAPPAWLTDGKERPRPEEIIALQNCLLDISGSQPECMDLTEEFFTLNYLPIEYDPTAACPKWLEFLGQIFQIKKLSSEKSHWDIEQEAFEEVYETAADSMSIDILQEFMGLLLTPVTRYQKILGLVGPKRSGKGTIGRIIRALVGKENVCSPTLGSMTNEHGLQSLYLRTVALIGDASINSSNADTARAVERLKSISGEDSQQINPKGKPYIEVDKMRVRFVVMANELQKLADPTGALAGRFVYLLTTQSFYNREDVHLDEKLAAELPGIFNWALSGYMRLKERGYFLETEAGMEAKAMAEELGSPVISFVREWCVQEEGRQIRSQTLYEAYKQWCGEAGRSPMGRTRFYEEFQRAFPECGRCKVRDDNYGTSPIWTFQNIDLQPQYCTQWT